MSLTLKRSGNLALNTEFHRTKIRNMNITNITNKMLHLLENVKASLFQQPSGHNQMNVPDITQD